MNEEQRRTLLDADRRFVWHPFTQMKDYATADHVLIERAQGPFVYGSDGQRYYDAVSSWWVNIHGHNHPRINEAIARQLGSMEHVMFSGFTHQPAIELASRLVAITPEGLDKVFYSDNGSTAVEVALKMSFQYWRQVGKTDKTRFVFLDNGYHGDTIGAVSVGGVDLYHKLYKPLLFATFQAPSPYQYRWPGNADAFVEEAVGAVEELFAAHADEIAGMIVEPMIQAAGGMIIYPAEYLRRVRDLCDRYGVHLIADEVAVGFGRTGRMFGCNHADVSPDIMCLSKGLTAGYVPLSVTLCTQQIYDAFYDDYDTVKTFFHGHSFTANPIGCAVALESLNIFDQEDTMRTVARLSAQLSEELKQFAAYEHVGDIRHLGMVGALELVSDRASRRSFPFQERIGQRVYQEGLRQGVILRPLGDTIYFWLQYCLTPEQMHDLFLRTHRVFQTLQL